MNKSFRIFALALMAFAIIGISSCDFLLTLMASPTVTVVDARSGSAISGVTVTLTPIAVEEGYDSSAVTGSSSSTGVVTFASEVAYGTYTVSGTLSGYVFIPFEATVAGWNTNLGKMFGVSTSKGDDTNAISIFLTWSTAKDIDAYLTYPDTFVAASPTPRSYVPYYDVSTSGETRRIVYYGDKDGDGTTTDVTTGFAYLDVDKNATNGGLGPETVTLSGVATGGSALTPVTPVVSTTDFIGGVLPDGTYVYMGDAVYYLDGYETSTASQDMSDEDISVVITQGSNIKGIFSLPSNMPMKTGSLFRVSLFYSVVSGAIDSYYFVFMPDLRLTADRDGIKSLGDNSMFVVSGKK